MTKLTLIFAVFTTELRSDQVSAILGCYPDSTVVKGADRIPPKLRPPAHGWFLDKVELDDANPAGLLADLLDRVRDLPARLDDLRAADQTTKVKAVICVTPFSAKIPFVFPVEVIRVLAALGASFEIEFFES